MTETLEDVQRQKAEIEAAFAKTRYFQLGSDWRLGVVPHDGEPILIAFNEKKRIFVRDVGSDETHMLVARALVALYDDSPDLSGLIAELDARVSHSGRGSLAIDQWELMTRTLDWVREEMLAPQRLNFRGVAL